MRKTVAAATMAASLTMGGAAGVALFTPTISGAQTDETTPDPTTGTDEQTDPGTRTPGTRIADALAPLVEDGTITQAQADAVAETLAESAGEFRQDMRQNHRKRHLRFESVGSAAEALGLEVAELHERLGDGETLRDIAASAGVSDQAVVDAIVVGVAERLDAAVAAGRMTEDEAATKLAEATERAQELLDKTFEGRGDRPGPDGPDAPADDADTTES